MVTERQRPRVMRRRQREASGGYIIQASADNRSEGPATWETIHAAHFRWTDAEVDAAIAAAAAEEECEP